MSIKTTVYLPEDLKALIEQQATFRACSEAEVIRGAIAASFNRAGPGAPSAADAGSQSVDQLLFGFGNP